MNKSRIAILVAIALGTPVGVVALERAASELSAAPAAEQPSEAAAPAETPLQAQPSATEVAPVQREVVAAPAPARRAVDSKTFPQGSLGEAEYWPSPRAIAYFDGLQRAPLIAKGDAFPAGTEGEYAYTPVPAQVAYFERLEQQRLARLERTTVAAAPAVRAEAAALPAEAPAARAEPAAESSAPESSATGSSAPQ